MIIKDMVREKMTAKIASASTLTGEPSATEVFRRSLKSPTLRFTSVLFLVVAFLDGAVGPFALASVDLLIYASFAFSGVICLIVGHYSGSVPWGGIWGRSTVCILVALLVGAVYWFVSDAARFIFDSSAAVTG